MLCKSWLCSWIINRNVNIHLNFSTEVAWWKLLTVISSRSGTGKHGKLFFTNVLMCWVVEKTQSTFWDSLGGDVISFLTSNVTSNLHGYEVNDEPEWSFCSSVAPSRFFSAIQSAAIHSKKCQEPVGGILFPESCGSNSYSLCLHLKCLWRWRNVTSFGFSQHIPALQDRKDKSQPISLLWFDDSPLSSRFLLLTQSYVVPKDKRLSLVLCVWYSSDETVGSSGITLTEELVSLCEAGEKRNRKEWLNSWRDGNQTFIKRAFFSAEHTGI